MGRPPKGKAVTLEVFEERYQGVTMIKYPITGTTEAIEDQESSTLEEAREVGTDLASLASVSSCAAALTYYVRHD
jgi:hypothetical protein